MNIEHLISNYLDGELSPEAEAELHYRLSLSPEGRKLFREHLALRGTARDRELLAEPSTVMRAALFTRLAHEGMNSATANQAGMIADTPVSQPQAPSLIDHPVATGFGDRAVRWGLPILCALTATALILIDRHVPEAAPAPAANPSAVAGERPRRSPVDAAARASVPRSDLRTDARMSEGTPTSAGSGASTSGSSTSTAFSSGASSRGMIADASERSDAGDRRTRQAASDHASSDRASSGHAPTIAAMTEPSLDRNGPAHSRTSHRNPPHQNLPSRNTPSQSAPSRDGALRDASERRVASRDAAQNLPSRDLPSQDLSSRERPSDAHPSEALPPSTEPRTPEPRTPEAHRMVTTPATIDSLNRELRASASMRREDMAGADGLTPFASFGAGAFGGGFPSPDYTLRLGIELPGGNHQLYAIFGSSGYAMNVVDHVSAIELSSPMVVQPPPDQFSQTTARELWYGIGYRYSVPLAGDLNLGGAAEAGLGGEYVRFGVSAPVTYDLDGMIRLELTPMLQYVTALGSTTSTSSYEAQVTSGRRDQHEVTESLVISGKLRPGVGVGVSFLFR